MATTQTTQPDQDKTPTMYDDVDRDQLSPAVQELYDRIDLEHLSDRLEGRNTALRSSKPDTDQDTGLTQYVWRMAQFHAGGNTSMPVTASWWLDDYLEGEGIDVSVSGVLDDEGKEARRLLETVVNQILTAKGLNPAAGAKRWKKAGLF